MITKYNKYNESTKMTIQPGQDKDIRKAFPNYDKENSEIIAEGGNDNGETFRGSFLVKIGKSVYRFDDGKFIKKVK